MPTETITKLAAAERQLNEAIRLFFERRDIVAVHTLAAASDQVLSDICVSRGIESQFRHLADFIRDEFRGEWFRLLKQAENFFKHADRDPGGTLEFNTEKTMGILFDATVLHWRLTKAPTHEVRVFLVWFFLKKPNYLRDGPLKQSLVSLSDSTNVSADDFAFFAHLVTEGKGLASRWGTFPGGVRGT